MSIIKKLSIKNFLGIDEMNLDASKINLIKGPMGSGKSSIIEAIEKAFTNKNRRTEVVKHGEEEATVYIETDDELKIDRRIRNDKADYLKVRKDGVSNISTEKFLRSLINGEIFRPLDWINKSVKEQTQSILAMLEIGWSMEDIEAWFGETPSNIDYNQHILIILKSIEQKYYKDREEVNRKIKELKTQIKVILDELPAEYDGEIWREKKVQEYYNKVSEAQKINTWIAEAKRLQESFEEKVNSIKANAENEKTSIALKFRNQREDIKDIIDLSKNKIEKATTTIEGLEEKLTQGFVNIDNQQEKTLIALDKELEERIAAIKKEHENQVIHVKQSHQTLKDKLKKEIEQTKEDSKDIIAAQQNKISAKEQELINLGDIEKAELKTVDEKIKNEIEKEEVRVGKAAQYLKENEPVDIEPLQKEADEVATMQSYLRQWDMMKNIRDGELTIKEQYSALLTQRIDKARELPGELLKVASMPIEGISVDSDGKIRINETLIDGLSDGESLELAFKIAKAQAGDLKLICIDRWESLKSQSKVLLGKMLEDDFQYFITEHTENEEFTIEKIG